MRLIPRTVMAPALCCIPLLGLVFVRLMNFELRKDEQLYASPARLLDDYSLYKDLFYNHTPGSAWLFHEVMRLAGTDHLLFAARIGVFAGWVVFVVSLVLITYSLTRSSVMTCLSVFLIIANETLLNQTGMAATNNFLPLALAYLGLGLFLVGTAEGGAKPLLLAASGFALSMAAVFKVNALVFAPIVGIGSIFLAQKMAFHQRVKRTVVPLAVGGILGAIPVFAYLLIDPERFIAHILGYHIGPHIAYWASQLATDEPVIMATGDKAKLAYSIWFSGTNLLFVFCVIFLLMCLKAENTLREFVRRAFNGRMVLVLASFLASVCVSFVPTPAFPQYFTLPLVCAPLVTSLIYIELGPIQKKMVEQGMIAACLAMLFSALPQLAEYAPRIASPKLWTVERVTITA